MPDSTEHHIGAWYGGPGPWCSCGEQECGYCGSRLLADPSVATYDGPTLVSIEQSAYDRLKKIEAAAKAYFEVMVPTGRIVRGMRVFRLSPSHEPAQPLTALYNALED